MLYKYTAQAGEQVLQWCKAGKELFFYFAKYTLIVTLTLLTDALERQSGFYWWKGIRVYNWIFS